LQLDSSGPSLSSRRSSTFRVAAFVHDVNAQIGEGGIGQVYLATDTKLKRQVAVTILPGPIRVVPRD